MIFSFQACAQQINNYEISVEEVDNRYGKDSTLVLIDVRTPQELVGPLGHIEGVINIPVQELTQRIGELEQFKDKEIAIICRTGNRSGVATNILNQQGYNAKNVVGGMTQYRSKNLGE